MNKYDKHFWIPYIILLALTLVRLIPFFYPESRTWGFNHLIFLSALYSFDLICLSMLAFILLLFPISKLVSELIVTRLLTFCLSISSGVLLATIKEFGDGIIICRVIISKFWNILIVPFNSELIIRCTIGSGR